MRTIIWNRQADVLPVGITVESLMFKCEKSSVLGKGILLILLVVASAGCKPKTVQASQVGDDDSDSQPSRAPTFAERIRITAPEYKTPRDGRSECFGRIMFDVAAPVEWPTYYRVGYSSALFNRSFDETVADPSDNMLYGDTRIAVLSEFDGKARSKVFDELPAAKIEYFQQHIKDSQSYLERLRAESKGSQASTLEIEREERSIGRWQNMIKDYQTNFEKFDIGLADSQGYWTSKSSSVSKSEKYSVLRAYLSRGRHIYIFESTREMKGISDKDAHKRDFLSLLSKFRARAAGEIPGDRGVCIPFGFIADAGTTAIEFKQSFRYPEAPGVLYTLNTGTVGPRNMKVTPLMAATEAMISPSQSDVGDAIKYTLGQRIAPRVVRIGGLPASQGGVVIKATPVKGRAYEVYSVFTGYGGWLGTNVLPYVLLNMHTMNREVATSLPAPPPFSSSRDRMERILSSMRWRPTDPVMPEFIEK